MSINNKNLYDCDPEDMQGFQIISRSLLCYISKTAALTPFEAAADLIYLVSGKETLSRVNGQIVHLQANERILSQSYLATRWKWDRRKVKRFLERLQADSAIVFKTEGSQGEKYTRIRVARANARAMEQGNAQGDAHDNTTENQPITQVDVQGIARDIARATAPAMEHNIKSIKSTKSSIYCSAEPNSEGTGATLSKAHEHRTQARQLIQLLNELTGKSYQTKKLNKSIEHTSRRVKEFGFEDLAQMVRFKVEAWKGTNFEQYLRPSTLFHSPSKTETYVEEAQQALQDPRLMAKIKEAKLIDERKKQFLLHGKTSEGGHGGHSSAVTNDLLIREEIYQRDLKGVLGREIYSTERAARWYKVLSPAHKAKVVEQKNNPANTQNDLFRFLLKLAYVEGYGSAQQIFEGAAFAEFQRCTKRLTAA